MKRLLGGEAAAEIRAAAAQRISHLAAESKRAPCLAAVGVLDDVGGRLFFDVKQRAFAAAGATFRPMIFPAGTETETVVDSILALNDDEDVDAIYVEYPMPPRIDAQRVFDAIAPAKDVDSVRGPDARGGTGPFAPATAEAIVSLLVHHQIRLAHSPVTIIRGDEGFANALAGLLAQAGAHTSIVALDDVAGTPHRPSVLGSAETIIVATGVVNGVRLADLPAGITVVDAGYYHGAHRGDVSAPAADIERLVAFAPPTGSIGPLTIAILLEHTVTAAERRRR